jgi:exodeoxyribonuclease V gamma subunit
MRSVPHRVVAVLGLDDGAFPRHPETDGDDLLLASPHVGDRDARSEDRQLLLDAVLAATEHLIITYSGRDERTNRTRPPAVPVAELLDTVDATVRLSGCLGDRTSARHQVVGDHPLQPFDPRNFMTGELCRDEAWSYDRVHLAGSQAFAHQAPADAWLPGSLPPVNEPVLQLDDVVRFVQHPVQAFLRRRLGLYVSDRTDELQDALPIDLDSLEKWGVGDRLLQARLAGTDPARALAAERARGLLPPGRLADAVLAGIQEEVERLAAAIADLGFEPGPADSLDVHLDLPKGRALIGTVAESRGGTILVCTYSRLAAKHRLGAWVRFLAVSAARPELDTTVITVGRGRTGNQPPQFARLAPLGVTAAERRQRALQELAVVLDLYDRGLRAPLPLACKTSGAWAEARHRGKDEHEAGRIAGSEWGDGNFPERNDAEHRYVWGKECEFARLLEEPPATDERGSGWPATEASRFGTLACRLWYPLIDHEDLGPAA